MNRLLETTTEAPQYKEDIIRQPYDNYPFGDGWLYTVKNISVQDANTSGCHIEVKDQESYVTAGFTLH